MEQIPVPYVVTTVGIRGKGSVPLRSVSVDDYKGKL